MKLFIATKRYINCYKSGNRCLVNSGVVGTGLRNGVALARRSGLASRAEAENWRATRLFKDVVDESLDNKKNSTNPRKSTNSYMSIEWYQAM
jgi:hypothetical protein